MVQYLNNNANSGFAAFMAAQQNNAPKRSKFGTFLWWTFLFLVAWWIVGLFVDPQQKVKNITDPEPFVTVDVSNVPVSNISSDVISANVQGMRISNIDLKNFTRSAKDDKPVTLIDKGFIEIGLTPAGTTAPTATTVWKKSGDNMVWHNSDNIEFSRTITVDGYLIKVSDTIKNNSKRDFSFTPFVRILRAGDNTSSAGVYTGSVAYVNNDIEHHLNISKPLRLSRFKLSLWNRLNSSSYNLRHIGSGVNPKSQKSCNNNSRTMTRECQCVV